MGLISKEKYDSILKELEDLKNKQLPKVLQQINAARLHGDLSENAEYSAARAKQKEINSKIASLLNIIGEAEVIGDRNFKKTTVGLFAKVRIKNIKTGQELTYQLVSNEEASYLENKISISSELGKKLNGKKKGDRVFIESSKMDFEIVDLSYSND